MDLYRHPFYAFTYDPRNKIITFTWTAETEKMQVHDYQEAIHNFAGFAFDNPATGLLVDLRDFRYRPDRQSTRLNSSHMSISYAVFCLKKKTQVCSPGGAGPVAGARHAGRGRGALAEDGPVRLAGREEPFDQASLDPRAFAFFFNAPPTTEISTLSLHDALPI